MSGHDWHHANDHYQQPELFDTGLEQRAATRILRLLTNDDLPTPDEDETDPAEHSDDDHTAGENGEVGEWW